MITYPKKLQKDGYKKNIQEQIVIAYSLLFVESAIRKAPFFGVGEWGSYQNKLRGPKKMGFIFLI